MSLPVTMRPKRTRRKQRRAMLAAASRCHPILSRRRLALAVRLVAALCCCSLLLVPVSCDDSDSSTSTAVPLRVPCTLCPDGSPIDPSLSTKTLPFLGPYFGYVPTCSEWEDSVSTNLNSTSVDCGNTRTVSTVCGCEPPVGSCNLCPEGQNITAPDRMVPFIEKWYGFVPTCELWDGMLNGVQDGSPECTAQRLHSQFCGCTYFDFDKNLWIILCRTSGTISLLASLTLLVYIARDPKIRSNIYHQIILAIASSDIVSSICFVLADIPLPEYATVDGELVAVNTGLCTAQGFFIQLGFSAMFFNASLTLFYMLSIAQGWTPSKIQRISKFLLGVPIGVGLILAFAGIPFYQSTGTICHLPDLFMAEIFGGSELVVIFLAVVPLCVSIVLITCMQMRIFWFVRQSEQKMLNWRFTRKNRNGGDEGGRHKMTARESKVFWQSACYVGSFYITWPVVLAYYFLKPSSYDDPASAAYKVTNAAFFLWPLQGFFTCLVYFRPKILKAMSCTMTKGKATEHHGPKFPPAQQTGSADSNY